MKNRIITISRQFGSGGRTVGREVAQKLGIPCSYTAHHVRLPELPDLPLRYPLAITAQKRLLSSVRSALAACSSSAYTTASA